MDIKILVATHKKYWMPEDKMYVPIHVGKLGKSDMGFMGDDTGDNISIKNSNYCELTGLYWAWKNLDAEVIGLVHYRRHFVNKKKLIESLEFKKKNILKKEQIEFIFKSYDIITPNKRKYYIETNRSHYCHAHYAEGLDLTGQIVGEMFPEYKLSFDKVMDRTSAHMFNMFIMRKQRFDEYCAWLFAILFELEKRLDFSEYSPGEARVFGYISEMLFDVWLDYHQYPYYEVAVSFMEKQNWLIKGGNFLKRKIWSRCCKR